MQKNFAQKGFTLLEMVIYSGLLALLLSSVVTILYQIAGSHARSRERTEVENEANFLMQKIEWTMSGAQTIAVPAVNTTGTSLSINKFNDPNTYLFSLASGTLSFTRGTSTARILNSSHVSVVQALFNHLPSNVFQPEGVSITLQVKASSTAIVKASTTLQTTIYLKK